MILDFSLRYLSVFHLHLTLSWQLTFLLNDSFLDLPPTALTVVSSSPERLDCQDRHDFCSTFTVVQRHHLWLASELAAGTAAVLFALSNQQKLVSAFLTHRNRCWLSNLYNPDGPCTPLQTWCCRWCRVQQAVLHNNNTLSYLFIISRPYVALVNNVTLCSLHNLADLSWMSFVAMRLFLFYLFSPSSLLWG